MKYYSLIVEISYEWRGKRRSTTECYIFDNFRKAVSASFDFLRAGHLSVRMMEVPGPLIEP